MNWIDLVSSILGLTCVVLAGRNSKYNFWVGYLYTAALFLLFWIWADSAGVMPLWFNAVKFAASFALGTAVSMPVASIMLEETEAQWK